MDPLSAFLHSPTWERVQRTAGFAVGRDGGNLFVRKPLPARGAYASSSRCDISAEWQIPEPLKKMWFLRLEPADLISEENLFAVAKHHKKELEKTVSVQPRQTTYLDLTQSEEDLLKNMKGKHRYNIGVARKHSVKIELITKDSDAHFTRFWNLLEATAGRQGFRTHSREYYQTLTTELEKDGLLTLGFATVEGEDLATVMLLTYNNVTTYLHGASSTNRREAMAPFLLHWEALTTAKSNGVTAYDFWGTNAVKTDNGWEPKKDHPSTGTTRFKLGFGGEIIEYPGTFDLILNPICYTLYASVRGLRSRKRAFS